MALWLTALTQRLLMLTLLTSVASQRLRVAGRLHGADNADLVRLLRLSGAIHTDRVERVMKQVDRGNYCYQNPYTDRPQPIGFGATISAPHMHAYALETLSSRLQPGASALDIGSGSGYLTACLALMVGDRGLVVGIDHIEQLVGRSRRNIEKDQPGLISSGRVQLVTGDGRLGYAARAPYDVIHVGAAAAVLPELLVDQLKPGGRLLIPVGAQAGSQFMERVDKAADGNITRTRLLGVVYVPLTDRGEQWPAR